MAKLQFSGPKRNLPFSEISCGRAKTIAQKAVSLQPTKFYAIPTPRPMISTSVFLPCAMISGVRESPEMPWRFVLHQLLFILN